MKKVTKAILIALAAAAVLVLLALAAVNLYVQSPGTQARIQQELSKALRLPLKITNTSLTPWSDLRITGITVPNGDANFLEATSFNARYKLLPLFAGRLEIPEMTVENPKVVWMQSAEGKWKLPESEEAAAVAAKSENQPPGGTLKSAQNGKAARSDEPRVKQRSGFVVVFGKFQVKNGSVELLDAARKPAGSFSEVNITYTTLTAEHVEGVATIRRAVWSGCVFENVRAPFSYAAGEFTMPELTASVAGGLLRGNYRGQPDAPKSPFALSLAIENVNAKRLASEMGSPPDQVAGTLAGNIELHGDSGRFERAAGAGRIELRDGQLRQLDILQTVGQVLGIRELSDVRLQDAHAAFHVGGEKVFIDELELAAADLRLSGKGTVRFDQKMAIEAQLAVEDAILKRLPGLIRDSFASTANGRRAIDFNITGTTEKPRTNILDKLVGQKIGAQFGDLLSGIFGGAKKDDEQKKKEDERKKEEKKAEKERRKLEKLAAQKASVPPPPPAMPAPVAPSVPPPNAASETPPFAAPPQP